MKHSFLGVSLCLVSVTIGRAQQKPGDAPATKEEVEQYLETTHARDLMKQMIVVMSQQSHAMVHEQYSKNADKLPPDFEAKTAKMMDDMLKNFPVDEMLQAMVPVYQKHWTKGDIDVMVAFYQSPTGQKLLREMPATMAETMQAIQPIMQKQMKAMTARLEQQVAQMLNDSKGKPEKPQTPD